MRKIISKLEDVSSILWFAMDVSWMCEYIYTAKIFSILAIITSFSFIANIKEAGAASTMVSFAVTLWLIMNTLWMINYIIAAKIIFLIASIIVIAAIIIWPGTGALDRFKRFKKQF